ncbi:hypothetical protein V6N11_042948 [Hibiscus sabdariffa]|uniref:Uncharacterized protein n=1 Tax=Hibiscus sabdariffa TaxID=183260 RepID=A0ABR2QXT8_9ROSI
MLKSELLSLSENNSKLRKQIRDLKDKLQLAEQGKDHAEKQFLVMGEQHQAGAFGTVKALRTNPTIIPDKSVNQRLAKILEEVAVEEDISWHLPIQISNDVRVYKSDPGEGIEAVGKKGGNHAVSGLKF